MSREVRRGSTGLGGGAVSCSAGALRTRLLLLDFFFFFFSTQSITSACRSGQCAVLYCA